MRKTLLFTREGTQMNPFSIEYKNIGNGSCSSHHKLLPSGRSPNGVPAMTFCISLPANLPGYQCPV